jgi:FixJ family two-component response regulator
MKAAHTSESRMVVALVEDDAPLRAILVEALAAPGVDVRAFASAEEVDEAALDIRVLVTDMHLPGMSGLDLGSRLRAVRPDLPIVLVSADASVRAAAERLGATFFVKPFDVEALATHVVDLLALRT